MLDKCLPFRYASLHFCHNVASFRPLLSIIQLAIRKEGRLRFRHHSGTHLEVHYTLRTFGLGAADLPVDVDGNYLAGQQTAFIENTNRLAQEEQQLLQSTIQFPNKFDVLVGRGRPFQVST